MKRWVLIVLAALGTAGLVALGVWQLERRVWKLALIERVEQRVHATPVAAPGPALWAELTRDNSEYLHVAVSGRFLAGHETLVQAVTESGGGFWVMAPFQTDQGFIVLVNRGFVPPEWRDSTSRAGSIGYAGSVGSTSTGDTAGGEPAAGQFRAGELGATESAVSLSGLLRMTEPSGAFLRANAPAKGRWYSRDVAAISQAQNLPRTAPYFIDADAGPTRAPGAGPAGAPDAKAGARGEPVGGLTVIAFHNSHLVYAITWFTLALMVAALGARIASHRR